MFRKGVLWLSSRTDNPYKVLGVKPSASRAEIKKAYRALAAVYHPDAPRGNKDKFQRISSAYEQIKDGKRIRSAPTPEEPVKEEQRHSSPEFDYEQLKRQKSENMQRNGGVRGSWAPDASSTFEDFKKTTTEKANIMIDRYAFATTQGLWMRKHKCLIQLIARERWLVKGFLSAVRNECNLRRTKHPEKSKEFTEFVEEIEQTLEKAFAKTTRLTERSMKKQIASRIIALVLGVVGILKILDWTIYNQFVRNSNTVKFGPYFGNK